jgi:hypothetical protein
MLTKNTCPQQYPRRGLREARDVTETITLRVRAPLSMELSDAAAGVLRSPSQRLERAEQTGRSRHELDDLRPVGQRLIHPVAVDLPQCLVHLAVG